MFEVSPRPFCILHSRFCIFHFPRELPRHEPDGFQTNEKCKTGNAKCKITVPMQDNGCRVQPVRVLHLDPERIRHRLRRAKRLHEVPKRGGRTDGNGRNGTPGPKRPHRLKRVKREGSGKGAGREQEGSKKGARRPHRLKRVKRKGSGKGARRPHRLKRVKRVKRRLWNGWGDCGTRQSATILGGVAIGLLSSSRSGRSCRARRRGSCRRKHRRDRAGAISARRAPCPPAG